MVINVVGGRIAFSAVVSVTTVIVHIMILKIMEFVDTGTYM
jgi:hypothetical protein